MSFVTTLCGAAGGSATPPDPCAHSGAATSEATAAAAHHRAHCVIPTSVEGPGDLLPCAERESDGHVAAGGGLVIPPAGRVDYHRSDVPPVEPLAEPREPPQPHAADVPSPPQAQ